MRPAGEPLSTKKAAGVDNLPLLFLCLFMSPAGEDGRLSYWQNSI